MTQKDIFSFLAPMFLVIELLFSDFLFAKKYEKRNYFWFSFLGLGFASLLTTFFIEIAFSSITDRWFKYGDSVSEFSIGVSVFFFFFYCQILFMTILTIYLSFKVSFIQAMFLCSSGYALQHIGRNVVWIITMLPFFKENENGPLFSFFVEGVVFLLLYLLSYYLFIRKHALNIQANSASKRKAIISFVVAIVCIGMSRITVDVSGQKIISILSEDIYSMLCCFLILQNVVDIYKNEKLNYEVDQMEEMLRNERRQYEMSKENIEIINIKCHDLKHQLSALKQGNLQGIEEIENAIMIYDSSIKTGNEQLDILLTEKKLLCQRKNIKLTCVVNGKLLSFMDSLDVYSLFGNAISNAIESVCQIQDVEKRCINLIVSKSSGFLVIHAENFFTGTLEIQNGLPQSKKDSRYHGFGMKSMQRIALKYKGEIAVSTKDDIFRLDILIPLPKEEQERKEKE